MSKYKWKTKTIENPDGAVTIFEYRYARLAIENPVKEKLAS